MQFTDEQQRFIDEHYQLLPVDADGVPIRVGDEMAFEDGEEFEVKGFGGSRAERLFYLNENGRFCWGIAENCRHVKPDSWVRIIGDAMSFEGDGWYSTRDDAMAELVERCRRLAGEGA